MRRALPLLLFIAAASVAGEPVPPGGRPAIVDRAIAFHGGERYLHSDTQLGLCSKSGCFEVRSRLDGEHFAHTVAGRVRDGQRKVRMTNDTVELWLDGAASAVAAGEERRLRDWAMARVYFCFLPYRLGDPSVRHQDLGIEEWDGRALARVKVTFEAGSSTDADDEYVYWFDPETGRLELFAYSYSGNPGGLRFRRAVNHRRIGGLLFFDQENLGVEGEGLTVDAIDPAFVAERMRHVSSIRLRDIVVRDAGLGAPL